MTLPGPRTSSDKLFDLSRPVQICQADRGVTGGKQNLRELKGTRKLLPTSFSHAVSFLGPGDGKERSLRATGKDIYGEPLLAFSHSIACLS